MVNKKIIKTAVYLLLLLPLCLIAENGTSYNKSGKIEPEIEKNYFIQESDKGLVLIQRLSWETLEDILAYEFELEQKDSAGIWKSINKKRIEDSYIDLSLAPGNYRYKITVINLLDQPEVQSAFRYFDVRVAYQPEVSSISPKTVYFDDIYDEFIMISGKNFYEETTFSLVKNIGGTQIQGKILELDKSGTRAKIKFNMNKIQPGEYNLNVTDISGLQDNKQKMTFKFQKPVDVYISGGYAFTGFIQNQIFKEYFNANFAALGGTMRITIMPIKRSYGSFGFNITGSGMYIGHKNSKDGYSLKAGYILSQLNAAYLLPIIRRKLNFDLHIGIGTAFLIQTQFTFTGIDIKSPKSWFWGMTVNGGTALQIYLVKKLYLEINFDHIIALKKGFPIYTIQPSLSVGWEF